MKIRYLGTAATEGFPAAFCNCKSCTAARKDISKELRTRSQMLIDTELMIDFPPESYYHAMRFGVDLSAVRTLLVTHSHTDHFYAQEFVNRGYKFAEGIASEFLDIYGNRTLSPNGTAILRDGMVFSIEPGVYFEGKFGIRVEDSVMLRGGKVESFMKSDKKLTVL